MRIAYLDNSATTPVDKRVLKEMLPYFSDIYGNPSSMHIKGLEAKRAIEDARKKIAKIIGADEKEIIFTGGGTESVNLAIKGVAMANKKKGNHIITTKIEHHAVLEACKYLEEYEGFEVSYVDVEKNGIVSAKEIERKIRKDTILISVMYANNEIGTIQPVQEISRIAKNHNIFFHTDACQAACYLDINVKNLGVDLMTVNGSKIYGPKGVGFLFVKKDVVIVPLLHGGGQEFGLRSGTENVPSIVGLAKALEIAQKTKLKESKRLIKLRNYLAEKIIKNIPNCRINGDMKKRLPNNLNISIYGVEGESLLLHLDAKGICASTGSACSSHSLEPSHVIMALGLPIEASHGSLRFSLGRFTTKEDINRVVKELPKIVKQLREISPLK
ncbi:MAG: cysteine desulfurase NifS [Candidatus Woesearchaeota archaeon]